ARVWDARSGQWADFVVTCDDTIRSASFSPDGQWLLTYGDDRTVRLWEVATGQLQRAPWRHPLPIRQARFSPDGCFVARASDNQIRIWNLAAQAATAPFVFFVHATPVVDLNFTAGSDLLVFSGADGTMRSVPVDSSQEKAEPRQPASAEEWMRWAQLLSGRE